MTESPRPRLDIVIPVYNEGANIVTTLRAISREVKSPYRVMIVYDFSQSLNRNIGKARTRGVEVGWRQSVLPSLALDANYTYLGAQDLVNDTRLLRRPHHAASLGVDWRPIACLDLYPRLIYVGSRPDVSEVSGPVTDPSYLRVDFTGRWQVMPNLAPYLRLTNAFNHQYDEAAGYPNPGLLVAGGVDVRF